MGTLIFNADEIFEIAKRIERRGMTFYRQAAERMPDTPTRELMLDLAGMEEAHERTFADMQRELSDAERAETLQDPHADAFRFLQGMADGYVFDLAAEPAALSAENPDVKKILRTAIERETESIAFYACIKGMVPPKYGQVQVDEIMRQEMGHVVLLSTRLHELRSGAEPEKPA